MTATFYFVMLGFFLTHELDAVKRHEWRIFPLTSFLPERVGEQVFIWLHVPIFAVVLIYGTGDPMSLFAQAVSVFAVIHVGLHWLFRNHPLNEFNNLSSWGLILGAGFFGLAHLIALHG